MSKVQSIAIICEDASDFESVKKLIKRITGKDNLTFKKKIANGCGKIMRKCLPWSDEFARVGCDLLVIIHDRDRNKYDELHAQLTAQLKTSTFDNRYVCIPVEELEAWFLSDPNNIKQVMKLDRLPKVNGLPETINSPKEHLGEIVRTCSNNRVTYLNTTHNEKISETSSLELMASKCPSFKLFAEFITAQKFV